MGMRRRARRAEAAASTVVCALSIGVAAAQNGDQGCPCITQVPARLTSWYPNSSCLLLPGSEYTGNPDEPDYCYPVNYGLGGCGAWDDGLPPFCAGRDGKVRFDAPSWCTDAWCYVDKRNCRLSGGRDDLAPSIRDQDVSNADQLVYSYATCGITSNYAKYRRAALMNATTIVRTVESYVADFRDFIEQQATVIRQTEGTANCDFMDSCTCTTCNAGSGSWVAWDNSYTYSISLADMTVTHTGRTTKDTTVEKESQCLARLVEGKFKRVARLEYNDPARLGWLMWGDQRSAVWFGYPGIRWCPTSSSPYDPRFRPWYVSAVSGPKDVVIVLDRSNSMLEHGRWQLAKEAVKMVLDTLTEFDYATIVTFHSSAQVFDDEVTTVPVTAGNLDRLRFWIDHAYPMGATDFRAAFRRAFDVAEASIVRRKTSGCNRVMLFLTDGHDGSGVTEQEITAMNQQGFTVFTYSFGAQADNTLPKAIACANRGIWYHVNDGGNLGRAMSSYFNVYAEALSTRKQIRWTMYNEISTTNKLITGCLPAYDRSKQPHQLLGVICMDVSIIIGVPEFEVKADYAVSMAVMREESSKCFTARHSEDELERLRGTLSGGEAQCSPASTGKKPSTSPAARGVSDSLIVPLGAIVLMALMPGSFRRAQ